MDLSIISVRYAKALLKYADERQQASAVYRDMQQLAERSLTTPALHEALTNPVLPDESKHRVLLAACGGSAACSPSTAEFLRFVIAKKRADLLPLIAHAFLTLYCRREHLVQGRLTTAVAPSAALSEKMRETIAQRTGGKVQFDVRIDASIGAGFILQYGDYRLDASLRTRLAHLRRALQ